ncbi:MAG: type II toxin-antitoxin system HicA family toxin, partial [Chthoniobacterales bacterium]
MSRWGARKARVVLRALEKIGWQVKRQSGSHKVLS